MKGGGRRIYIPDPKVFDRDHVLMLLKCVSPSVRQTYAYRQRYTRHEKESFATSLSPYHNETTTHINRKGTSDPFSARRGALKISASRVRARRILNSWPF